MTTPFNEHDEALAALCMLRTHLKQGPITAFRRAVVEFQAHVKTAIETDRNHEGIRVGWRLSAIRETIRDQCLVNDLTIRWGDFSLSHDLGNVTGACFLAHIDGHEESSQFQVPLSAFEDLKHPAQRYVAAVTLIKRITLEAVCGIASREIDDELNKATYSTHAAHAVTSAPESPESLDQGQIPQHSLDEAAKATEQAKQTPQIDLKQLQLVKKHWIAEQSSEDLEKWQTGDMRIRFYQWLSAELKLDPTIAGDNQVTPEILENALKLLEPVEE